MFRINLHNLEKSVEAFNLVDINTTTGDEDADPNSETITRARFHGKIPELFAHGTSKGKLFLSDLRQNTLHEHNSIKMVAPETGNKHFFSEMIACVNDMQFLSNDGNKLVARDYLTVKLWDVRQPTKPYKTIQVCDYLEKKLCDFYENE
jgi:serine/threonine-protein phosphatase 2A regulatory subunit B